MTIRYAHQIPNGNIALFYDSESLVTEYDDDEKHDVFEPVFRDLTSLTSAQCQTLLAELVEPKIQELEAHLQALDKLVAEYQTELASYDTRTKRADEFRLPEIKHALRLLDYGLANRSQAIYSTDVERLGILSTRPGRLETKAILEALGRDASYLRAVIKLWPDETTTRAHKYMRQVEGEFMGADVKPGDVRELTEKQSRSLTNVFALVKEPAILTAHRDVLNAMTNDNPARNLKLQRALEKFGAAITSKKEKAA